MMALPESIRLLTGDTREVMRGLDAESVQCCVTSPPYWGLRDYGVAGQIGLEQTPAEYVAAMVDVFREVRRLLRPDGTLWLNLGDSYAGSWGAQSREHAGKHAPNASALSANQVKAAQIRAKTGSLSRTPGLKAKDLVGIPWRVAFALQSDGWWLRSDIIWAKPNPMPESIKDRPTRAHEYLFLLTKGERYLYDSDAIKEPATGKPSGNGFERPHRISVGGRGQTDQWEGSDFRNRRSVWTVSPEPFSGAHFAVMPTALVEPCILAGSRVGDAVLDPFSGSGTVAMVAWRHDRRAIGIDLNPEYVAIAEKRIEAERAKGFQPALAIGGAS